MHTDFKKKFVLALVLISLTPIKTAFDEKGYQCAIETLNDILKSPLKGNKRRFYSLGIITSKPAWYNTQKFIDYLFSMHCSIQDFGPYGDHHRHLRVEQHHY